MATDSFQLINGVYVCMYGSEAGNNLHLMVSKKTYIFLKKTLLSIENRMVWAIRF